MTRDQMAADLAYVRELAESGRSAPPLGGRFALLWGGGAVIALVAHWAVITGRTPMAPELVGLIWLAYGVIGSLASVLLGMSLRGKPGVSAVNNRVAGAVWRAITILIFVYAGMLAVTVSIRPGVPLILFDTIIPLAFGLYAVADLARSAVAPDPFCRLRSGLSFAAVGGAVLLLGRPELYLLAAAFVLLAQVAPGVMAMAREPKSAA